MLNGDLKEFDDFALFDSLSAERYRVRNAAEVNVSRLCLMVVHSSKYLYANSASNALHGAEVYVGHISPFLLAGQNPLLSKPLSVSTNSAYSQLCHEK